MQAYRFLTGPDDASFCHKITQALNKGWQLYGHPQYTYNEKTKELHCGQAVIKTIDQVQYTPDMKLSDY